jgi:hypothetical protein
MATRPTGDGTERAIRPRYEHAARAAVEEGANDRDDLLRSLAIGKDGFWGALS